MSTTPDDPTPPGSGFTVRARARVGGSQVRPEVADALGDLERSLADVATWEALQEPPWADVPLSEVDDEVFVPEVVVPEVVSPADEQVEEGEAPDEIPVVVHQDELDHDFDLTDLSAYPFARPSVEPDDDDEFSLPPPIVTSPVEPLLPAFAGATAIDDLLDEGGLLTDAVDVEQGPTVAGEAAAEAKRRRRNGRVLTWAGVVVLAAVAALYFVPDRDDDAPSRPSEASTTIGDGLLLDPDLVTTSSTAPAVVAPVEPVESATTTTRRATPSRSATPRRTTPTTTATTVASPTITALPGQPCAVRAAGCNTTSTTTPPAPVTIVTTPPTTETTSNPGTFPPGGFDPNQPNTGTGSD